MPTELKNSCRFQRGTYVHLVRFFWLEILLATIKLLPLELKFVLYLYFAPPNQSSC